MEIKKIIDSINTFFSENVSPPHKITSVEPRKRDEEEGIEAGWDVVVEVIEERDYMRKYARDEMLGIYEAALNSKYEIISYSRINRRYRSAVDAQ